MTLATLFFVFTALAAPLAPAADFSFVDPKTIDLARLLSPPPSDSSEVTRAELDAMLIVQQRRSAAQAAQALADNEVGLERFSDALGRPLQGVALPQLDALLRKVQRDQSPLISASKQAFKRPRPYALEKGLKPVVPLPGGESYPSGHATWGHVTGLLLADMVPERRAELLARADEYSRNRVIAGVHYPSDVEAGRMAATIFVAFLFASPAFETERAAAAKELRGVLGLGELPRPAPKT